MPKPKRPSARRGWIVFLAALFCAALLAAPAAQAEMIDTKIARLQSLDKVTGRTMSFEAKVGSTVKFGSLYIKIQSCRKASPLERPESASFLQIWEIKAEDKPEWVFSGWMYASSPALSAMDHPIYDVWVNECVGEDPPPAPAATDTPTGQTPPADNAQQQGAAEAPFEDLGD